MIPNTLHNLSPFECISALQKYIRRGMEREAMEVAVEMGHTSKAFAGWIAKRLEVISHEDIGLAAPEIIPLVAVCCHQAMKWYDAESPGKWRMVIGTAIRAMCRAPKSREGDHFQAAVGHRAALEGFVPQIPDWVQDGHTQAGKIKGRGLDYFREVSTRLDPPPTGKDPYEDEAYRLWALAEAKTPRGKKRGRKSSHDVPNEQTLF